MDRPTCGNLDKIHRSIRASTGFKQVKSAKTICTVEEIDLKGVCLQIVFTAKEDFFCQPVPFPVYQCLLALRPFAVARKSAGLGCFRHLMRHFEEMVCDMSEA
jgi:hypothetical protein